MAHIDVVPVDVDAPWRHPAFEARIVDGQLWGRGTLDDKGCLVGIAEAVERLLEQGFRPAQDIWLSFGSTEEVSGETAQLAVEELRQRGVEPWFVLDEGGAVAANAFPGIKPPLAVIGVSEKGTTTLELRVDGRGGHASTPVRMDATAPGPRDRAPGQQPVPGLDPGADARDVPTDRTARPASLARPDRQRRAAASRPHPGPDRRRSGARGTDPHDSRGDHPLRVARAQRDRVDCARRSQRAGAGRQHRRVRRRPCHEGDP